MRTRRPSFSGDQSLAVHRQERLLLGFAAAFLACAQITLILARGLSILECWHMLAWGGTAFVGHRALQRWIPRRDPYLFPVVMLLTGWGILLIERVAPVFAARQSLWLLIAMAACIGLWASPAMLRWLSRYRYLWLVSGLILLAATILLGRNPSAEFGPRLWLGVDGFYIQPSEILKVVLITFIASYFADYHPAPRVSTTDVHPAAPPQPATLRLPQRTATLVKTLPLARRAEKSSRWTVLRLIGPLALMFGLSVVVLAWQRDLGTAALLLIVFLAMLYLAGGSLLYVLGGAVLLLGIGVIAYFTIDLVQLRVDIWLNPWLDPRNRAFQIVQSLMAFASGGVFGQGSGQGSPTYVPVVHSDFIFAAVGEEWGVLGTLAVIALLALVVARGLRLALALEVRPFRAYLATGASVMIGAQSLLILGGALKLIPLTGVTLPFMSYGGSSLLVSFVLVGLILALSGET